MFENSELIWVVLDSVDIERIPNKIASLSFWLREMVHIFLKFQSYAYCEIISEAKSSPNCQNMVPKLQDGPQISIKKYSEEAFWKIL